MKKVVIGILTLIFAFIGLLIIYKNNAETKYINNVIKTESYSYLSEPAKEYIKEVYKKTKEVVLTEKNKKANEPYLNPQFISYLSLSSEEKKEVKVIPKTFIVDYTDTDIKGTFPSRYDLRDSNQLSPMKNQQTLGICWAFAASEQAESLILRKNGESYNDNPILLSPRQIDYATSTNGIANYTNEYGYRTLTTGGSFILATQVLANGVALQSESNFPFNLQTSTKSLDKVLNYAYSNYEVNATTEIPSLADVTDTDTLNSYVSSLKELIYNYGGGVISAQDPQDTCATTNTDGTLILRADDSCDTSIAHDMQVIGWDDEYEYSYCKNEYYHTQYSGTCANPVSGTGAWIIRNSWGTNVNPKYQYLYIAYDSIDYEVAATTEIDEMSNRTWDRSYVETPFTSDEESISYYISSGYTAHYNKIVGPTEKVEKVKFSTINSNGTYRIIVTADSTTNYTIDEIINTTYPGLYTVDLSAYNILFDDNIAVRVYSTNSGKLLYQGVNVFTSYTEDDAYIETSDLNGTVPDDEYHDFNNVNIYSATANIPSNSQITYELYDDDENDLTSHISNITNNYVAHNDVYTKMSLNSIKAGHYILRLKYNGNSFDANINLSKPPMIIYHQNYGDDETTSTIVEENVETNLDVNTFTRTGYKFINWNTKPDGSGTAYEDGQTVTINEDLILYAQWTPITYKVVFHSNNGLDETIEQTFSYDENKELTLNSFTKEDYVFSHWASSIDDSNPHYSDGEKVTNLTTTDNDIIDLYAIWSIEYVTITFDANSGEGNMDNQNVIVNTDNKLNKNLFTKTGYKFNAWNTQADGEGTSYTDEQIVNIDANLYLYAQWLPISYTINYIVDGTIVDTKNLTYEEYTIVIEAPTKTGYMFTEWNLDEFGEDVSYEPLDNIKNLTNQDGATINIYAIFNPIHYTVAYNPNGAPGEEVLSDHIAYDENYTLIDNPFTYDEHTFIEWNTMPDGSGTSYEDKETVKNLSANDGNIVTLYAIWQKNTTVVINTYTVDETNKFIDKIPLKTSIDAFTLNLVFGSNYKAQIDLSGKDYIYTGLVVKIVNKNTNELLKEYKCIVRGDINGDGKASALDYVKVKNHIMKTNIITDPIQLLSADANEDNKISALDYVRIKNIIMKG